MTRYGRPAVVGALGSASHATVDAFGVVRAEGRFSLEWWVGGDDRWYFPAEEASLRQRLVGGAPIVETSMRVPSGDAVQRVYGAGGPGGPLVVEVENRSPVAFSLALVLHTAPATIGHAVTLHGNRVRVGKKPVLVLPREPVHWAVATKGGEGTRPAVVAALARDGLFPRSKGRTGVESAFLFPVAHGTTRRAVLLLEPAGAAAVVDVERLPDLEAARRGWAAQLERGMRVELPGWLGQAVGAACATLLLLGDPRAGPTASIAGALAEWGFLAEAATARRAGRKRREEERRTPSVHDAWGRVQAYLAAGGEVCAFPGGPAGFLGALRDVLAVEHDDAVDLLPGFPPEWLGQDLAVHDLPTRGGPLSFALRWHGDRPALLWESPPAAALRASRLDPAWSTAGGKGDALLGAPLPDLVEGRHHGAGEAQVPPEPGP